MTDIEIAHSVSAKHIKEVASFLGIPEEVLEFYGKYKAKVPLTEINQQKVDESNLILVTAITPTPAGEGKTTVSIGLNDGLNKIGKKSVAVLREPSLGPVFGMRFLIAEERSLKCVTCLRRTTSVAAAKSGL